MGSLVQEAREINPHLSAFALLNAADATGRDNQEALDALKEIAGIDTLPLIVGRRKVYPNAASEGRAVTEHRPRHPKALREMAHLISLLYPEHKTTSE
jgi:chromosome partitioning protein